MGIALPGEGSSGDLHEPCLLTMAASVDLTSVRPYTGYDRLWSVGLLHVTIQQVFVAGYPNTKQPTQEVCGGLIRLMKCAPNYLAWTLKVGCALNYLNSC
jgi:hypothetical protein